MGILLRIVLRNQQRTYTSATRALAIGLSRVCYNAVELLCVLCVLCQAEAKTLLLS